MTAACVASHDTPRYFVTFTIGGAIRVNFIGGELFANSSTRRLRVNAWRLLFRERTNVVLSLYYKTQRRPTRILELITMGKKHKKHHKSEKGERLQIEEGKFKIHRHLQ